MKPAAALILAGLFCVSLSQAQGLRKLATLSAAGHVRGVSVCGDTGLAAVLASDGAVIVWRVGSGEAPTRRPAEGGVRAMACSADAKQLAIGKRDGSVTITNISGKTLRTLAVSKWGIDDVAFSPDCAELAVSIHESPVELWNPATGARIATLETRFSGTGSMDFSPDSSLIATADLDTAVRIYDKTGKLKAKYEGLLLEPFTISFMPDGKQVVVGGADCTLTFLDAADGHVVRALPKQPDPVVGASVLPGGTSLLSLHVDAAALKRFTVNLWDLRTATPHDAGIDGRKLVGYGVLSDHQPVVFTVESESRLAVWTLPN